jgi:hypothetical protein
MGRNAGKETRENERGADERIIIFLKDSFLMAKNIDDARADEIVAQTVATMAFEGLYCDEEDKASLRRIALGETTADEEVAAVIKDFHKRQKVQNA